MRKIIRFKRTVCPVCGNRPRILSDRAADNRNIVLYTAYCCSAIFVPTAYNESRAMDMWREKVAEYRSRR